MSDSLGLCNLEIYLSTAWGIADTGWGVWTRAGSNNVREKCNITVHSLSPFSRYMHLAQFIAVNCMSLLLRTRN